MTNDTADTPNDTVDRSTPSIATDSDSSTAQPLSRRGFVKKVAAAGVLGVGGMAAGADTARAATNIIRVEGETDGMWSNYTLEVGGDIWEYSASNDLEDSDNIDDGYAWGTIFGTGSYDSYAYTGNLMYVRVDGHVRFHNTDPTATGYMAVAGLSGWSDYLIVSEGNIEAYGNIESGQDDYYYGGARGSVFEGGEDHYWREDDIIGIVINGNAEIGL